MNKKLKTYTIKYLRRVKKISNLTNKLIDFKKKF